MRINVTKTFLPPLDEYEEYLKEIWDSGHITNQGPMLQRFESEIKIFLGVKDFHMVSNGTVALQLALRGLDILEGEIITTSFSYVATTSSILWERCTPVFVDIEPETFCIDPAKIEAAITKNTKAILAVHVFGNPCAVDEIDAIAKKHNIKVIYDGAHAIGVKYHGKSIFSYGDVSTCSFHATKLLHTIEGGGVFVKDKTVSDTIELLKRFGHTGDEHFILGINAKATELQAAMGLVNLKHIAEVSAGRKRVTELYDSLLTERFGRRAVKPGTTPNYAYYPLVFKNEAELKRVVGNLQKHDIHPRRYFYPSLNTLPYINEAAPCPVSEDIASRIVCLPLYYDLANADVKRIAKIINES